MLPGFGASLETWRDIEPFLSPEFTLYLIDLKGEDCPPSRMTGDMRFRTRLRSSPIFSLT